MSVHPCNGPAPRCSWHRARSGPTFGRAGKTALASMRVRSNWIVYEDGTIERWQQPELPAWEVPKRNPHERRPRAPLQFTPRSLAKVRYGSPTLTLGMKRTLRIG
jgi:hypothetical protein